MTVFERMSPRYKINLYLLNYFQCIFSRVEIEGHFTQTAKL